MPPSEGAVDVLARPYRYESGESGAARPQALPVETPINFVYGGVPFAVMVATPDDLEDFALGFSLTEGIIENAGDIRSIEIDRGATGIVLNIALGGESLRAHLSRSRAISGRTGCGLCGIDDLANLPAMRRLPLRAPIDPASVSRALRALEAAQPLNAATHAVHAAGWFGLDGALVALREDVGRHNALDKLIGALARAGASPDQGFLVITSRCSFEMVAKAAWFGASTLVSISAPTSLAIERAKECGLTIIGVARADHALLFTSQADQARGGRAA
jgi:FdhD protein